MFWSLVLRCKGCVWRQVTDEMSDILFPQKSRIKAGANSKGIVPVTKSWVELSLGFRIDSTHDVEWITSSPVEALHLCNQFLDCRSTCEVCMSFIFAWEKKIARSSPDETLNGKKRFPTGQNFTVCGFFWNNLLVWIRADECNTVLETSVVRDGYESSS
jgi:hypothetical protein